MPSASLRSKYTVLHLQSSFCYYSQHPNCIPGSFSSSKSKLIFSKYILNFPFNPTSKYLCYYLCCMYILPNINSVIVSLPRSEHVHNITCHVKGGSTAIYNLVYRSAHRFTRLVGCQKQGI